MPHTSIRRTRQALLNEVHYLRTENLLDIQCVLKVDQGRQGTVCGDYSIFPTRTRKTARMHIHFEAHKICSSLTNLQLPTRNGFEVMNL